MLRLGDRKDEGDEEDQEDGVVDPDLMITYDLLY